MKPAYVMSLLDKTSSDAVVIWLSRDVFKKSQPVFVDGRRDFCVCLRIDSMHNYAIWAVWKRGRNILCKEICTIKMKPFFSVKINSAVMRGDTLCVNASHNSYIEKELLKLEYSMKCFGIK